MTVSGHFVYNESMIKAIAPTVFERHVIPEGTDWTLYHHLIITREANVFIDAGLGPRGMAELALYADPSKPHWLIYTHHHFDHVWGAEACRFSRIIASEAFNDCLMADYERSLAYFKSLQEGPAACVYADTLIQYKTVLGDVVLYPAPGHTVDGLMVHVPSLGFLFTGDNLPDRGKGPLPELEDADAYRLTLEIMIRTQAHTLIGAHDEPRPSTDAAILLKALNITQTIT
jgi:hydroxyacylglutathione hydrolase